MRVDIDRAGRDHAGRYTHGGEPFTGEIVVNDRFGAAMRIFAVAGGVRHGPDRRWYPDGGLESEFELVHGRIVGIATEWHPNGVLAEERVFDGHGNLISLGRWDEDDIDLPDAPAGSHRYFGSLPPGRTRDDPAGVIRRRGGEVDGLPLDEDFTRNLRWEPTTRLVREQFRPSDTEYVEISEAEAERFVRRITRKLGPP